MKIRKGPATATLCILAICALASGCIRSRVIVTSEPPGADVTLNGLHRGRTPIEIPFIWYWYYDFELTEEGYEPLVARERFHAPVYAAFPPLDLLSEAAPVVFRDTRRRHYTLVSRATPAPAPPPAQVFPGPLSHGQEGERGSRNETAEASLMPAALHP